MTRGMLEATPDLDAAVVDVRMPPTSTDEGLRAALVTEGFLGRRRWLIGWRRASS